MKTSNKGNVVIEIIVAVIFILISVFNLFLSLNNTIKWIDISYNYKETTAILVEYNENYDRQEREVIYSGVYEYIVDGNTYTLNGNYKSNQIGNIGKTIEIKYNPQDPKEIDSISRFMIVATYVVNILVMALAIKYIENNVKWYKQEKSKGNLKLKNKKKKINIKETFKTAIKYFAKGNVKIKNAFKTIIKDFIEGDIYIKEIIYKIIMLTVVSGVLIFGVIYVVVLTLTARNTSINTEKVQAEIMGYEESVKEGTSVLEYFPIYKYEVNGKVYVETIRTSTNYVPIMGEVETIVYYKGDPSYIYTNANNLSIMTSIIFTFSIFAVIYIWKTLIIKQLDILEETKKNRMESSEE